MPQENSLSEQAGWVIGAYAAAPSRVAWNPADEARFLDALADLPGIAGFEIPFTDKLHKVDEGWLLGHLRPNSTIVITTAPGTSDRLRAWADFGIASTSDEGRRAALAHADDARRAVRRMNDALGRSAVVAVELHAAPANQNGASSAHALFESLEELAGWDWDGAQVALEHCDAAASSHPPAKGYLALDDEIETILRVNRSAEIPVGVAINWGRSVIEQRDPDAGKRHVELVRAAGLLTGLMFSGCAPGQTRFGGPWADVHAPPAPPPGDASAEFLEPRSLLTPERIADTVTAAGHAGPGQFRGIKTAAPPTATVDERIRAVSQAVELVLASRSSDTPILTDIRK